MINLKELYEKQNKLDEYIVKKSLGTSFNHNSKSDFLSDRLLALFVEVGEFANKTRCFKYWSKKPEDSKPEMLEEYVDMLHFFLSIGNTMGFTATEVEDAYRKKNNKNRDRQNNGY